MKRLIRQSMLTCVLALSASGAYAATCSITSAQTMAFGNYASPGGSQTDTTGAITVTCTPDFLQLIGCSTTYTISLSKGGAASYSPRTLASGANHLNYNLYTDAARSAVWGDGTGGSITMMPTISSSLLLTLVCQVGSNTTTVYGRIPASQSVAAGSYSDTITVTVTY